ncbi:hypothetical protein BC834DRAFT_897453 [Gloeopeniophorella convolvens]|nr:hypothetical protein BC834DRAFT_897453 [Gloeopeniophorella convolvens]
MLKRLQQSYSLEDQRMWQRQNIEYRQREDEAQRMRERRLEIWRIHHPIPRNEWYPLWWDLRVRLVLNQPRLLALVVGNPFCCFISNVLLLTASLGPDAS